MNKGIIVGIGAVVIVVLAAGSFFGIAARRPVPQRRAIELEAKEFRFEGLGYKLSDNMYK